MGMRETTRSLSIYFIIGGLLGLVFAPSAIAQLHGNTIAMLIYVPNIGFEIAFLYFGFRLRYFLQKSPQNVIRFLIASFVYSIVASIVNLFFSEITKGFIFIGLIPGLLITLYLINNIRRLSTEEVAGIKAPAEKGLSKKQIGILSLVFALISIVSFIITLTFKILFVKFPLNNAVYAIGSTSGAVFLLTGIAALVLLICFIFKKQN